MKKIFVYIAVSLLWILSSPAFSGDTYHNVPGPVCGAFNNSQADRLERSHVRISLPISSPTKLWIVCPIQSVAEDLRSTINPPQIWVNAYFGEQVPTGTEVTCIFRNFNADTTHFPGDPSTPQPDETVTVVSTKTANTADAETVNDFNLFTTDYTDFDYYTATCQLAPGTGINSIDMRQW